MWRCSEWLTNCWNIGVDLMTGTGLPRVPHVATLWEGRFNSGSLIEGMVAKGVLIKTA